MAKYDLTSSLEKDFTFAIGDKEFVFTKPTVRQMRTIASKFSKVQEEKDPVLQEQLAVEATRELYSYAQPIGHTENVETLMDDQPIEVQMKFNDMIKKELGVG